jgi:peptidoglycan/xylan/chitin deacetylase (PgdA/CDA1 family)
LKKIIFPILSLARPFIPLKTLVTLSGQKLIFPFYHAVSDVTPPHLAGLYKVKSLKEFEGDLDFLLKHFNPVTIDEVINEQKTPSKPSFHLSFDDGLREISDFIEPILTRKGIPATFFVNPDFIDNKNLFFRYKASVLVHYAESYQQEYWKDFHEFCNKHNLKGKSLPEVCFSIRYKEVKMLDEIAEILGFSYESYLREFNPYLSNSQLESLVKKGFTVGAHSMDHPEYWNLTGKEMLHQTLQSANWVKERYKQKYSIFAFPFSDKGVGSEFFRTLGYDNKPLISISFGTAGIKNEVFKLHKQRIPLEGYNLRASAVVFSEYLYYLLKMPFGKNIIYR